MAEATKAVDKREFIGTTRFRKQPIVLGPSDNPAEFRASKTKLAHARETLGAGQFDLFRPHRGKWSSMHRKHGLFWQLPEWQRPRARQLLTKNIAEWAKWRGVIVKPGMLQYAWIIRGIVGALKRNWTSDEARQMRAYRISKAGITANIKNGRLPFQPKPKPQSRGGVRASNTLGEL